jgi:PAS domain S-box-containing protein/putative nucleotidyltransferase with HDIG domain
MGSQSVSEGDELGRQVILGAQEGVVATDRDQRITLWNPFMAKMTGVPESSVLGRLASDAFPFLAPAGITGLIERALAGEWCPPMEVAFASAESGEEVRVSAITAPLRDGRGEVVGVIGMVSDITDRWRIETSLRANERRLIRAQSIAHVGNWELDLSSRTIWASPECFRVYGVEDSGTSTLPLEAVQAAVLPEYRARLDEALLAVIAGAGAYDEEFEIRRACDGELRVIHSRAELQGDDDGAPVSVLGALQDVTELKAAEREAIAAAARLRRTVDGTVSAMSAIVETRDPYTAGHQRRVTQVAAAMGRELGLAPETLDVLRLCGELHDIGKVAVPAEILTKPGSLTETEFALVKAHAAAGAEILASIDFDAPVAAIVRSHHERLDGSGYPDGLSGLAVPLEARIIAVADVVEAMSSHRPYRPAMGQEAALEEIRQGAGRLYDADAAAACERVFAQGFAFGG